MNYFIEFKKNLFVFSPFPISLQPLKVRFNLQPKVHVLHAWRHAYHQARRSPWEQIGRDRVRFQDKIRRLAEILNPVLDVQHRQRVRQRMAAANRRQLSARRSNQ